MIELKKNNGFLQCLPEQVEEFISKGWEFASEKDEKEYVEKYSTKTKNVSSGIQSGKADKRGRADKKHNPLPDSAEDVSMEELD